MLDMQELYVKPILNLLCTSILEESFDGSLT